MAIANTFSVTATGASTATTAASDSSGSSTIVIGIVKFGTTDPTVSDSKSNSWTKVTRYGNASDINVFIYKCDSPSVGSGHTFTSSTSAEGNGVIVLGYSGTDSSSVDVTQGINFGSGFHSQIGASTLTPTLDNGLVLSFTGIGSSGVSSASGENGFTSYTFMSLVNGVNYGFTAVYQLQTTATAISNGTNIVVFDATSSYAVASVALKQSTGGGGGSPSGRNLLLKVG